MEKEYRIILTKTTDKEVKVRANSLEEAKESAKEKAGEEFKDAAAMCRHLF